MLERVRKSVIEYYSWEQPLGQRSPLVPLYLEFLLVKRVEQCSGNTNTQFECYSWEQPLGQRSPLVPLYLEFLLVGRVEQGEGNTNPRFECYSWEQPVGQRSPLVPPSLEFMFGENGRNIHSPSVTNGSSQWASAHH